MKTGTKFILLGVIALLTGVIALWYFAMGKWAEAHQQTNATWRIQGLCTNVQNGTPIKDANITAHFWEPIVFKFSWRKPLPLASSNVITKTDDHGRFEVTGEGGHVNLKVQAKGYRIPETWEDWSCSAMNGITHVDTNIALSLDPYK